VKAIQKQKVKDYETFKTEVDCLKGLVSLSLESIGSPEYH